jgi:hypothetical protein
LQEEIEMHVELVKSRKELKLIKEHMATFLSDGEDMTASQRNIIWQCLGEET